jgi:hypothetical protein
MMSADEIPHIRAGERFSMTARTVIEARIEQLESVRSRITDEEQSDALHDLRIAAKRLRYSLDMVGVCFPAPLLREHVKAVRELQDVLGRIHDLDILCALLEGQARSMDDQARADSIAFLRRVPLGGERDAALRALLRRDPARGTRAGLYRTIAEKADERGERYTEFLAIWRRWEAEDVLGHIRDMARGEDSEEATLQE